LSRHRSPEMGARVVLGDQEMALIECCCVVDIRRVGRNKELGAGLKPHQVSQDEPVPLRIEVQLGLVDEDDPLSIFVERQRAQEHEDLELAGAELISLQARPPGVAKKNIEPAASRLLRGDNLHGEGLVCAWVELAPGFVDVLYGASVT